MGRLLMSAVVMAAAGLAGCHTTTTTTTSASSNSSAAMTSGRATKEQTEAMLGRVKTLAGEWVSVDENGQPGKDVTTVFTVTSAGSVVREVMFPGSPHEMTNMYHMDGPDLVVTHYCAAGNQPRMRCRPGDASASALAFDVDSATNLRSPGEEHMAQLTIEWKDNDTFVEHWRSMKDGAVTEDVTFVKKRKS